MTEQNPESLNYAGPSVGRPPLPLKVRRRRLIYGFCTGIGLTVLAVLIGVVAGNGKPGLGAVLLILLLVPGCKLLAALVLAFIRDWRSFGGGLALSSLLIFLIFLGTCAGFAR